MKRWPLIRFVRALIYWTPFLYRGRTIWGMTELSDIQEFYAFDYRHTIAILEGRA